MSDVWIRTLDGDLLRADEVRQITGVDGLRVVLVGGSQFLVADVQGRGQSEGVARELATAIANARSERGAVVITVERENESWTVSAAPASD